MLGPIEVKLKEEEAEATPLTLDLNPIEKEGEAVPLSLDLNPLEEKEQEEIKTEENVEPLFLVLDGVDPTMPAEVKDSVEETSNWTGGFISGLNESFSFNTAREARAQLDYTELDSWFYSRPYFGDNPLTPDVKETGISMMTAQDQTGVDEETWSNMSTSERLVQLKKQNDRWVNEVYNPDTDSAGYMVSKFLGFLTDPTTALPLKSPATIVPVSMADAALWSHSTTGEVDPETVVLAGTLSYAGYKAIKSLAARNSTKKANQVVNEVQNEMWRIQGLNDGPKKKLPELLEEAKKTLNISDDVLDDALSNSTTKLTKDVTFKASREFVKKEATSKSTPGSKTKFGKGMDYLIEPISEGIKRISPRLYGKLNTITREHLQQSHLYANMVDPFLKKTFTRKMNKTSKAGLSVGEQNKLHTMLLNARSPVQVSNIKKFLKKKGGDTLVKDYELYREAMKAIHKSRVAAGNTKLGKIIGYSPRTIRDYHAWYQGANKADKGKIDKIVKKAGYKSVKTVPHEKLRQIVMKGLRSKDKNIQLSGSSFARTRGTISEKQAMGYLDPIHAGHKYIKESMEEVQRYKVFGNLNEKGDIDQTIADYIARELKSGAIKGKDADALEQLLKSRFINGPKQMNDFLKKSKDVGYMTLLGHPTNAIRQAGDIALSAYQNGVVNTVRAVWNTMTKKMLTPKEQGLLDNIAEEFANDTATKRILDNVFKYSGFRSVDALGKGTLMNSTLIKSAKMMKTPKGKQQFLDEWTPILGNEIAYKVANDLKNWKPGMAISNEMRDVAFARASKFQPLSLIEMPRGYLDNPNGRMLYMLKTFTIKHVNVMRQDIFKQIRQGNIKTAMKNAALLTTYFTLGNMGVDKTIDLVYGRDRQLEETFYANLWRNTGFFSKYDVDKLMRDGDVYEWATHLVLPAFSPLAEGFGEIVHAASNLVKGDNWAEGMSKPGDKIYQNIPFIGRILQHWTKE